MKFYTFNGAALALMERSLRARCDNCGTSNYVCVKKLQKPPQRVKIVTRK